jgi:hypothetical protein
MIHVEYINEINSKDDPPAICTIIIIQTTSHLYHHHHECDVFGHPFGPHVTSMIASWWSVQNAIQNPPILYWYIVVEAGAEASASTSSTTSASTNSASSWLTVAEVGLATSWMHYY